MFKDKPGTKIFREKKGDGVTVIVTSHKTVNLLFNLEMVRSILSLDKRKEDIVGATRVHFGTQEMSMVVPPVTFKHNSIPGKAGATVTFFRAGVLSGGELSYSAKHPWGATSWGLPPETVDESDGGREWRKCELTVRLTENAIEVAAQFPEKFDKLIPALEKQLELALEEFKVYLFSFL